MATDRGTSRPPDGLRTHPEQRCDLAHGPHLLIPHTTCLGPLRGREGRRSSPYPAPLAGCFQTLLVDANGFLVACRVEPVAMSDRKAARLLTAGLAPLWPWLRTVIADAG